MVVSSTRRSTRAVLTAALTGTALIAAAAFLRPGPQVLPAVLRAGAVSPLLWGENLLIDNSPGPDAFLTDPALRSGLRAAHVSIVRLPVRGPSPSSPGIANWVKFQAAATAIKALGAAPLVILRNPKDPTLLADDTRVVQFVTALFAGTGSAVYYEWANETDYPSPSQVTAAAYVASWNATVPALKTIAGPTARWIGPVTSGYQPAYLRTFLQSANPRPDAVSWHEYTCATSSPTATCITNIQHWATHFTDARTVMSATVHTDLPIFITEWNYNAVIGNDPKAHDQAFLTQWTTTALQGLAAGGVTAAMHYNVDGQVPLVGADGTPATQGAAFITQYQALTGTTSTSTSASPVTGGSAGADTGTGPSTPAGSNPSTGPHPSNDPSAGPHAGDNLSTGPQAGDHPSAGPLAGDNLSAGPQDGNASSGPGTS